jgi:hypothetical protein
MTHAASNETNLFALKHIGPKREALYILTHQPRSLDYPPKRRQSLPKFAIVPKLL